MVVQATGSEAGRQVERDFAAAVRNLSAEPGYKRAEVLAEDPDWLVILLTVWERQEQAALFSSSAAYRLLLAAIEPRIVGAPVVRLFKRTGGAE
jgi:heme-degrading monooxygenase HmoA